MSLSQISRDPGSFRDKESWILIHEDRIIRRIPAHLGELLGRPDVAPFIQNEILGGRLAAGSRLSPKDAKALGLDVSAKDQYLTHPKLPFVSYPYEWSSNMLADAARLTLDMQCKLLSIGLELKDATPFNVLFSSGKPMFVDWGSFRIPYRKDAWYALGQFHRMFLYPILLSATRGWNPSQAFLTNLDGIGLDAVVKEVGKIQLSISPRLWLHVVLPRLFEKFYTKHPQRLNQSKASPSVSSRLQLSNLKTLSNLITRLERDFSHNSCWNDYATDCHYETAAESVKSKVVSQFLCVASPDTVLDLGCNTGNYSRIAARTGARVIAADGDQVSVSHLYSSLGKQPANIHPVVINFASPSPSLGWCNLELKSFISRGASDCVMALALVHHFRITCNWSAIYIVEFLSQLCRKHIIIEFVPREDPMFQRLSCMRDESYEDWDLDSFYSAVATKFNILKEVKLPASSRQISIWVRK